MKHKKRNTITFNAVIVRYQKAGIKDFKDSDGWLRKLKARPGISGKNLSGGAGSLNPTTVKNWNEELPGILVNNEMMEIYNCDESGFFWKQTAKKSLVFQGDEEFLAAQEIRELACINVS